MTKATAVIGNAIAVLLYVTVNLFLPSGMSIFSMFNQNVNDLLSNLPYVVFIAAVCEIIGLVIGYFIALVADLD